MWRFYSLYSPDLPWNSHKHFSRPWLWSRIHRQTSRKARLSDVIIFFNMRSKLRRTQCWQRLDRTFNWSLGLCSNLICGRLCSCSWHRLPRLTWKKWKYLKTGVKTSSSGYRRKELCQNVATDAALHHPRKDPSKRNQETPTTGWGP